MSALRYSRLPDQVPAGSDPYRAERAPRAAAPVGPAPPASAPAPSPPPAGNQSDMTQLLPQFLQAMPNGSELSKTMQQVSQMQAMMSGLQQGGGQNGLASLLPLLLSQQNAGTGEQSEGSSGQMMQMLPMMMQLMQQRSGGEGASGAAGPGTLSQLLSLLQAK